jgi:hypothetical protein
MLNEGKISTEMANEYMNTLLDRVINIRLCVAPGSSVIVEVAIGYVFYNKHRRF